MAKTIYHGEIIGSTDAAQLPSVPYRWGYIRAQSGNAGSVFLGSSSDVIKSGSTDTNTTCGIELSANQILVLDYLPTDGHPNLNELWRITTNAGDDLTYILWDW